MNANAASANNPITTSVSSVTRTWVDSNNNFVPDCDLSNFSDNGECGPISNQNFGKNNPLATTYANDVIRGWGTRDYLWDFVAELQHQIGSKISVNAGYNRNWTDNPSSLFDPTSVIGAWSTGVTDNVLVTPADYSPYCVTAPVDPRLPNGGGYQVCGLYDVSPAKFNSVQNVVRSQNNFGKRTKESDFFSAGLESQFRQGMSLGASVDTGRTVQDNCFVVDSPQQLLNCHLVTPFKAQTLVKTHWSYTFPGNFVASGALQNVSGISYGANWAAPNSAISGSLGRNLAACGTRAVCTATATIPLIPYMTVFDPRRTQLDLRLSKVFPLGPKKKLRADVDIYNLLNSSAVLYANQNYSAPPSVSWKAPVGSSVVQGFVDGRLIQFGGRLTF
jgi:hypothetical protein